MRRFVRRFARRGAFMLAAVLGATPLVAGCRDQGPKQENVREVVEAPDRARQVKAQADLQAINTALQEYAASNGRFPDRLEDLPFVRDRHLDASLYEYDPAGGQARLREP